MPGAVFVVDEVPPARESPVGFRREFHCTENPQWVFIVRGRMEIGLQDGTSRVFGPGEHFHSADLLPAGATFDPQMHGHWSRQVGDEPLATLFVARGLTQQAAARGTLRP